MGAALGLSASDGFISDSDTEEEVIADAVVITQCEHGHLG